MNFIEFLIAQAKFSGLSGGVQGDIKPLRVIENGTFEAPDGTAGYNPVVVNVLDPETGSPLKFTSGSFHPTADRTRMTIEHGLGCMPDFIMVYAVGMPSGFETGEAFVDAKPIVSAWGFRSCFDVKCLSYLGWPTAGWSNNQYGIDNVSETGRENGNIYCPDEATFQLGYQGESGSVGLSSGIQYDWIAVAGLGTVSESVIEPLTITENGTYTAPEGVDGYNPVTVNVPAPEIKLQDKTITENGEYTADEGFFGLGKILVEIASGGDSYKVAEKYFDATGTSNTIKHYLGVIPDMLILVPSAPKAGNLLIGIGFSSSMIAENSGLRGRAGYYNSNGTVLTMLDTVGMDGNVSADYAKFGGFRDVTASEFTVGGTTGQLESGKRYYYYALYKKTQ